MIMSVWFSISFSLNRKNFLTKRDYNKDISLIDKKSLNIKTNPTNIGSVNYNILSTQPNEYRNTISIYSNKKPIEGNYDNYEINCNNIPEEIKYISKYRNKKKINS